MPTIKTKDTERKERPHGTVGKTAVKDAQLPYPSAIGSPATLLLIRLPADAPGKATTHGSCALVSTIHKADLDEAPGC